MRNVQDSFETRTQSFISAVFNLHDHTFYIFWSSALSEKLVISILFHLRYCSNELVFTSRETTFSPGELKRSFSVWRFLMSFNFRISLSRPYLYIYSCYMSHVIA